MRIEVSVAQFYDHELVLRDELQDGDDYILSPHGERFALRRVLRPEASVTEIGVPDGDIERMYADWEAARDAARKEDPPRILPVRSRRELLAHHLAVTVMPHHAPSEHITAVKVVNGPFRDDEQQQRMEDFLSATLVGGGGDDFDIKVPGAATPQNDSEDA